MLRRAKDVVGDHAAERVPQQVDLLQLENQWVKCARNNELADYVRYLDLVFGETLVEFQDSCIDLIDHGADYAFSVHLFRIKKSVRENVTHDFLQKLKSFGDCQVLCNDISILIKCRMPFGKNKFYFLINFRKLPFQEFGHVVVDNIQVSCSFPNIMRSHAVNYQDQMRFAHS